MGYRNETDILPTLNGYACVIGARGEAWGAARLWGAAQALEAKGILKDTELPPETPTPHLRGALELGRAGVGGGAGRGSGDDA